MSCVFPGVLDEATIDAMKWPRCGVPDMINMASIARKRKRRFLTQGKYDLYNIMCLKDVTLKLTLLR